MNVDPNQPDPQNRPPTDAALPETLPPQLLRALRQAERMDDLPTEALDRAVLEASRQHFAEVNRQRRLRRFFALGGAGAALATAAAVAIVVLIGNPFGNLKLNGGVASNMQSEPAADQQITPEPELRETLPHDFNNDGKVDVGDSLYLANALKRGESPRGYDTNSDDQFTQADIDKLQNQIVELNLTLTQRQAEMFYAIADPETNPSNPASGGGS